MINVNDERSQQIVEGEAERLEERIKQRRFDREEIKEELILVLAHVDEEGTARPNQSAVIAGMFFGQDTNRLRNAERFGEEGS